MNKRVLFLINSLRGGGAEKVMVNLVNGLDGNKYDITVMALFGEGVNKQFLHPNICFVSRFKKAPKGFAHWTKLLSPVFLHKWLVRDYYDVEISYLQGVTTRIIAGAPKNVRKVAWLHNFEPGSIFRSKKEMIRLMSIYDKVVGVSKSVEKKAIEATNCSLFNTCTIYNTQDVSFIEEKAKEPVKNNNLNTDVIRLIAVGTLYETKGYMRLLQSVLRLKKEGFVFSLWFVGDGPQKEEMEEYINANNLQNEVDLLGFDKNPYKYMSKADLFVCSSYTEGFSGVVSEATILGLPTLTTRCPGMEEILGSNNEYGIIVDNSDDALFEGLKKVLSNPELLAEYKEKVHERKSFFDPQRAIKQVEDLIDSL